MAEIISAGIDWESGDAIFHDDRRRMITIASVFILLTDLSGRFELWGDDAMSDAERHDQQWNEE